MENKMNDKFTFYKVDDSVSEKISAPEYSYWKSVFKKFMASKVAIFMTVVLVIVLSLAIFVPLITGYDHTVNENILKTELRFLRPNSTYWFGTDDTGRDMFNMVWAGARTSLFIAFCATMISMVIGVIVGMFWGFSQKVDMVMIQLYNIISNVPFMLIAIILSFAFGAGVPQLIFAMSCTSWVGVAYFIRVQVMIIRDREYNLASKCLGSSTPKIIMHNILPYLVSVLVTQLSRMVPGFISYEVFLSYIGVGLSRENASLGRLIEEMSQYMRTIPYLFVIPLSVTAIISISLYLVGQALSDASDPRNHMI